MLDIDWKDLEVRAVATILLCLGNDVMYHVMDEEFSAAVWLKVESMNMSKLLTNKLYLKQRPVVLWADSGGRLGFEPTHQRVQQIISDLKMVDIKFEDEDKSLMLLNLLPTSTTYENLVITLTLGKESLELEDVIGALLTFHQRKKVSDKSSQGEGLIVNDNQECGRRSNSRVRRERILGQSLGRGKTSIAIIVGRNGT
jgi:hypothetical protein